jgi:hypothetical protein
MHQMVDTVLQPWECLEIECLACGRRRLVTGTDHGETGSCRACGYLGWAEPAALDEADRSSLHRELA